MFRLWLEENRRSDTLATLAHRTINALWLEENRRSDTL